MMHFVYFAKSEKNGKIYVGSTEKDPHIRVKEHNQSSNKWTSSNGPFKLIYFESFHCEMDKSKREKFYKTGIGKKIKMAIVKEMSS